MFAGAYYLLSSFADRVVQNYLAGLQYGLKPARFSWNISQPTRVLINVPVLITNMNDVSVTLQNFIGEIIYNGVSLSPLILSQIQLQAKTENTVNLTASVDITALGENIVSLIQQGNFTDTVRITGTLRTSIIDLPIDEEISLISALI